MDPYPIPQPAKAHLVLRRIPIRRVAAHLGCSPAWAYRVLNGRVPAPEKFRQGLAEYLDLPAEDLFVA